MTLGAWEWGSLATRRIQSAAAITQGKSLTYSKTEDGAADSLHLHSRNFTGQMWSLYGFGHLPGWVIAAHVSFLDCIIELGHLLTFHLSKTVLVFICSHPRSIKL